MANVATRAEEETRILMARLIAGVAILEQRGLREVTSLGLMPERTVKRVAELPAEAPAPEGMVDLSVPAEVISKLDRLAKRFCLERDVVTAYALELGARV